MPILIKTENPDGLENWGIIELQGDLEVRGNQIMSGQFIGDLCFDKYGKPILIIGHHILHGKEQALDKPFAVLQKRHHNAVADDEVNMNETNLDVSNISMGRTILDSTISIEHKTVQKTEYYVQAIVRRKIIFKSRPKPIIANVAKKV
ncbi:chromosome transmission fidelity protein 8 homolog [Bradysia coprophila]|uniref:chromosome transmission fidelity protein 8 homolog n=1 Tax=Bradysia coprophila TaxID=38358 RepID=UPI00187D8544|nr:chromosome transmission fidelity protein 8 homolog [Bradysia coprophila]